MKEFRRGGLGVGGLVPCPAEGEVLRCGEVEKRSASLFQGWKKKRAVLSRESLSLFPPAAEKEKEKEGKALGLGSIAKVDCVERTGKYLYFTLVTTDRREIDFRCPGAAAWDASIALALIDFQNQSALRRLFRAAPRSPREPRDEEEEGGGGMAAPTRHHQHHHRAPSPSSCP